MAICLSYASLSACRAATALHTGHRWRFFLLLLGYRLAGTKASHASQRFTLGQ